MSLYYPIVSRDHFEAEETGNLAFPCCCCVHRHGSDKDEPCRTCDHNANAEPAAGEGGA